MNEEQEKTTSVRGTEAANQDKETTSAQQQDGVTVDNGVALTPEEQHAADYQKFLTVADGVTLVRFKGNGETKLVARRVGRSGNPNTIFEIDVNHVNKIASAYRDNVLLFQLKGNMCNYAMVENMAVSALHRWFKSQRPSGSARRRLRKQREAAAKEVAE